MEWFNLAVDRTKQGKYLGLASQTDPNKSEDHWCNVRMMSFDEKLKDYSMWSISAVMSRVIYDGQICRTSSIDGICSYLSDQAITIIIPLLQSYKFNSGRCCLRIRMLYLLQVNCVLFYHSVQGIGGTQVQTLPFPNGQVPAIVSSSACCCSFI